MAFKLQLPKAKTGIPNMKMSLADKMRRKPIGGMKMKLNRGLAPMLPKPKF